MILNYKQKSKTYVEIHNNNVCHLDLKLGKT